MNQRVRDNRCSGSTHRLRPTKNSRQASAGKVILTIVWDVNGPISVHFQENGQNVISARYSAMLVYELKPAIPSKHRGLLSKKNTVASRQRPPPYGCAYSGYTKCSEILGAETSTIQSGLGAIGLSLVWTYERSFAGPEVCI